MIQQLHALCQNSRWVDAFELFITFHPSSYTQRRGHHLTTRDPQWMVQAWRSLLCGETRLLQRACAAAVSKNDVERVQRWSASLQPALPLYTSLRDQAQLSEQHLDQALDLVWAAKLALAARMLVEDDRHGQVIDEVCACLDHVITPDDLDETLRTKGLVQQSRAVPVGDASQAQAVVLDAIVPLLASQTIFSPQRLARMWDGARSWLGMPKAVQAVRQGQVATLEVELVHPGTGQAFQHGDDVLRVDVDSQQGGLGAEFVASMQHAFAVACRQAQRTHVEVDGRWPQHLAKLANTRWAQRTHVEVDGRWRLKQGQWPMAAGSGASASGQALRAFYGALTETYPDARVILLAEVTKDHTLDKVTGIAAKTQALLAGGEIDTLLVVGEASCREAEAELRARQAQEQGRVIPVSRVEHVVPVSTSAYRGRSHLHEDIERYLESLLRRLAELPAYYPQHQRC